MKTPGNSSRSRIARPLAVLATMTVLLAILLLAACGSLPAAHVAKTPAPTVTATLTAEQQRAAQIAASTQYYLSQMSLDQKLGQMMLIETMWTSYTRDVDNMVHGMHAGAMIVYKQNMLTDNRNGPALLKSYLASIQSHADLPMIVSMDEEGGAVDRLGLYHFAPALPAPQDIQKTGDPQNAFDAGARGAKQMLSLGINTNLAPLADVRLTDASILWTRMYGNDPATVDKFAGAFLQATQQNGVIGCVKHWPGIGSITTDPHQTLPVMKRTRDQLEATEWASFRGMIALDPGMIMVTHVMVPSIDETLPATLSPKLVQGTLRDELGYDGVVMTDSLYMKGISLKYNLGQAAVLAVEAGDDLLEGAHDTGSMRLMIDSIKNAMASGQITQARIDQSVRRILALKLRFGLLLLHTGPAPTPVVSPTRSPGASNGGTQADLPRRPTE